MMIWGDDVELKVLENQNKICSAMFEGELTEEVRVSGSDRQEIAEVTQLETSDVGDMLNKFNQMKGFHKFLKERRSKNLPMPESSDDLMNIYKIERPKFLMQRPNKHKRLSPKDKYRAMYKKHTGTI